MELMPAHDLMQQSKDY